MAVVRTRPQPVGAIIAGFIDPVVAEHRGIRMRSQLEAAFARHLDSQGETWTYEPAIYGDYLPDFELVHGAVQVFVEVKPCLEDVPGAKRRMRVIWQSRPEALLIVACAEGSTWFVAAKGRPWASWVERWEHH